MRQRVEQRALPRSLGRQKTPPAAANTVRARLTLRLRDRESRFAERRGSALRLIDLSTEIQDAATDPQASAKTSRAGAPLLPVN